MSVNNLMSLVGRSFRSPFVRNFTKTVLHQADAEFSIKLSDPCVKRLKEITESDSFLRVAIEGGGCSGFQYTFELDTKVQEDDHCFEKNGVKVVVDETSLQFIKGSTIDYHEELIRSAFRIINNPKAEMGCSCGASFSIKE